MLGRTSRDIFADYTGCIWNAWTNFEWYLCRLYRVYLKCLDEPRVISLQIIQGVSEMLGRTSRVISLQIIQGVSEMLGRTSSDIFADYTGCIRNAWTKFKSDFFVNYTGCIRCVWTNFKGDFFFLSFFFLLDLCLPTRYRCGGVCCFWSHSYTHITSHHITSHSVGLLRTRDQPDAETSTWQHNTHKRQISMYSARFEPAIPTSERPQTNTLDHVATGIPHKPEIIHHEYGKRNLCRNVGLR